MKKCGAYSPRTHTRCTRGQVHIKNGMQHSNDDGEVWALTEGETAKVLRPDEDFKAMIRAAVEKRLRRSADRNPYAIIARHRDCIQMANEEIEAMIAAFSHPYV